MSRPNLNTRFLKAAQNHAERVCLIEGDHSRTWAGIADLARLAAFQIANTEPRAGAAVGLLLPNSSMFVIDFFGTLLAGRVPMPMNPMLKPPEQAAQLLDSGARLVLTISHFRDLIQKVTRELGEDRRSTVVYCDELPMPPPPSLLAEARAWAQGDALRSAMETDPDATSVLLYTSGSTGAPKGVMLSHANLLANIDSVLDAFRVDDYDIFLSALPFFHIFGLMTCMILPILSGLQLVAVPRINPDDMIDAIGKHRATVLLLVPAMYRLLLMSRMAAPTSFSSVRYAVSGGSPLAVSLVERFKEKTAVEIFNGYGITETSPVIAVNNPLTHSRLGSVGFPVSGVEVRIADLVDGHSLPPGETGEIRVRGSNVMKGYYNKPDHTARVIDSQGWYHTGDLGKLDEDGFLYVSGRVDDMIIVAGKNIHPEDIEQVLLQHPEVQEAAAIGMPDEMRGQTIVAFVLPKPGAMPKAADLRAFCIPRLANHQIPKEFLLVRDLPRNTMGKVQRFRLVGEFRDYLLET